MTYGPEYGITTWVKKWVTIAVLYQSVSAFLCLLVSVSLSHLQPVSSLSRYKDGCIYFYNKYATVLSFLDYGPSFIMATQQ